MGENEAKLLVLNYDQPPLPVGYLKVKVSQTITAKNSELPIPELKDCELTVAVRGPQFHLLPQDVASVYPAPGGMVHHGPNIPRVIPHVMLTRSTLPWERTPGTPKPADNTPRPWLALIVLDKDEDKITTQAGPPDAGKDDGIYDVPKDWDASAFHAPSLGKSRKGSEPVQFMKLSWSRAQNLLPSWDDLRFLAHVRQAGSKGRDQSQAVIVACPQLLARELPGKRQMSAHLVSLENWYHEANRVAPAAGINSVLLVVLKSWTYTSAEDASLSIEALFPALMKGTGVLRIPAPAAGSNPDSEYFQAQGFAVLPHRRRSGGLTMSFYRGPFAPWAGADRTKLLNEDRVLPRVEKHLALGIHDVSYAATWELGRLMMLHDPRTSRELLNWKTHWLQATAAKLLQSKSGRLHLTDHLPVKASEPPAFPQAWFDRLISLEGIPFEYLVPDERMLPRKSKDETIRFFEVDRAWMEALVSGAFSVGSHNRGATEIEEKRKELCDQIPHRRGFLLRSTLVSDWPQLHFVVTPLENEKEHIIRRLSADVELHVFPFNTTEITIALPREALHFEWPPHDVVDPQDKKWAGHKLQSSTGFAQACLHSGHQLKFKF